MFKRLLKNNWVVTIGGGVVSVLVLRLIDWLFINDVLWEWIKGVFSAVVDFFNTDYTVKLYFLILLPILFVVLLIGVILLLSLREKNGGIVSRYPDWKEYTRDVFGSLQYRWQYNFFGNNYRIENLQRYCDQCSCALVDLRCPVCRTNYSFGHQIKSQQEVEALITHRIDNGLYKKSLGSKV